MAPVKPSKSHAPYFLGTRRVRRYLSREKIGNALRTLAWVLPLTLLIWVYAERQQERRITLRFPIQILASSPDCVVLGPRERLITAELRGPTAELELVKSRLLQSSESPPITLSLDQSVSAGPHDVHTGLVAADPVFRTHAIVVESTDPEFITVEVDQIVERDLTVRVPPGIPNLDGKPVFDPPRVKVRGPRTILDRVQYDGLHDAFADLSGLQSLKVPGPHEEKLVPLITQFRGDNVTLVPPSVSVSFKVRPADVTVLWPEMPIWINSPPGFGERYRVTLPHPVLQNLQLSGPVETLTQLQQDRTLPQPRAHLDLSDADTAPGAAHAKPVQFDDLPPGVSVAPEDAERPIPFVLEPRR